VRWSAAFTGFARSNIHPPTRWEEIPAAFFKVRQWPLAWQVVIVLAQFFAILLWMRDFTRWISGMDEMHRRITTSTILFAAGATFFFLMLWHQLDRAGLFDAIFLKPKAGGSWDICTVGHGFILMVFFYHLGHFIFNRRYK
jgi:hypothetical protein